jgi:hypothetical protein
MKILHDINRIVFYGCSFTAGSELADQELMPNLSKEEIDKLKIEEQYLFYERFDRNIFYRLENEKSWSRWFSDELNLPWVNRAMRGSSMGQIIFDIEKDINNKEILDTDLVIVGITSPERICLFNDHGAFTQIIHANNQSWDKKFKEDFILNIFNDEYNLFNWYKDIKYLDLLSNKLNGRLFHQYVWSTFPELLKFNTDSVPWYNLKDYMKKILNENTTFDYIIDNKLSFTALNAWWPENQEVLRHPKLEMHQNFGRQLAKSFRNKVSI